jgi:cell division protein FtsB
MDKFFKRLNLPLDTKKIILIVVAVILFFLVMDLNSRLNELSRLSAQRDKASTVVAVLESTLQVLESQVAYATSEGAVEDWAYNEGHMVRPGEKLIIPLVPPGENITPVLNPTPTLIPVDNWEVWMALLLGK